MEKKKVTTQIVYEEPMITLHRTFAVDEDILCVYPDMLRKAEVGQVIANGKASTAAECDEVLEIVYKTNDGVACVLRTFKRGYELGDELKLIWFEFGS